MALGYKLELVSPATARKAAKTWTFDPTTQNVISIESEDKKEATRIGLLQAVIQDPGLEIFNALPDPAWWDITARFTLPFPDGGSQPVVVFEGKVTALNFHYPAADTMTVVAHDKTIALRQAKKYRVFKNKTGVQVAQAIAKEYGLDVVVEADGAKARDFQYGAELSDWALIGRALAYDGLEIYTGKGGKLYIRQGAKTLYGTTFRRGEYPVISLEGAINHVSSGLDRKGAVVLEDTGTANALQPTTQEGKEAAAAKASQRTHRRPVGAPDAGDKSHSEAPGNAAWTNQATQLRRRKDEGTLALVAQPDLGLKHYVTLAGWGAKIDGNWFINAAKHAVVGAGEPTTTLTLQRAPTAGGSTKDLPVLADANTKV